MNCINCSNQAYQEIQDYAYCKPCYLHIKWSLSIDYDPTVYDYNGLPCPVKNCSNCAGLIG